MNHKAFHALYDYLVNRYPNVASNYSFKTFFQAAVNLRQKSPLTADLSELRRIHIQLILDNSGYKKIVDEQAFDIFWQARQKVTLYPDAVETLHGLSAKMPLITISNGNACTKKIGIDNFFLWTFNPSDTSKPKPDSSMFLLACEKLAIEPKQLLHIGDNLDNDIKGAHSAGCRSVWFNQHRLKANHNKADAVVESLSELLLINFFQG